MKAATILLCALILSNVLACKGLNFSKNGGSTINSRASSDTAADDSDDDIDESIALEPTSVGGAFLGCFIDRQIHPDQLKELPESAASLPVGCQAFDGSNFTHIVGPGSISIESAEIQTAGVKEPLTILAVDSHPRWAWITKVPAQASNSNLYFNVSPDGKSDPFKIRVELLDILPASASGLTTGSYKLRIKGSSFCLNGNPEWSWDSDNRRPIADSLQQKDCEEALDFRFSSFQGGLRLHVPNPKPFTCDTENYAVEFCSDSCVDLENFGLGNRFTLFACTKSVEAQSFSLIPGTRGAMRLRANGRYINLINNLIVPTADAGVEFELVPSVPVL